MSCRRRRRRRGDETARDGRGSVEQSLVSPGDLELTPFRAYSAIYYGRMRCSNNCANAQHDEIVCIRKSSIIVPLRGERARARASLCLSFPDALLLCSSLSIPRHFLLRCCTLSKRRVIFAREICDSRSCSRQW